MPKCRFTFIFRESYCHFTVGSFSLLSPFLELLGTLCSQVLPPNSEAFENALAFHLISSAVLHASPSHLIQSLANNSKFRNISPGRVLQISMYSLQKVSCSKGLIKYISNSYIGKSVNFKSRKHMQQLCRQDLPNETFQ